MGKAKIMDLKELDFYNRTTHPMACESYDEFKGEEKKICLTKDQVKELRAMLDKVIE